jgi:hypothetical protein
MALASGKQAKAKLSPREVDGDVKRLLKLGGKEG